MRFLSQYVPGGIGDGPALSRPKVEQRAADTPEVIARRLATDHAETEPIVEHYRATGKLVPLHADRTEAEVWAEIEQGLAQVSPA